MTDDSVCGNKNLTTVYTTFIIQALMSSYKFSGQVFLHFLHFHLGKIVEL